MCVQSRYVFIAFFFKKKKASDVIYLPLLTSPVCLGCFKLFFGGGLAIR